ncbi:MAG: hypothetical protein UT76_C0041G0007, partial [Candidatus Woesebacteria bacterium GW2011_GWB1_40_12]
IGKRRRRTNVFAGTPASTAPLIAYLTGLNGQTASKFCSSKSFSRGPNDSVLFCVISTGGTPGVGSKVAVGVGLSDGLGVTAETGRKPDEAKRMTIKKSRPNIFRMGINLIESTYIVT